MSQRHPTEIVYKRRGLGGLPPSRLTKSRAGSIASSGGAGDDSNASGLLQTASSALGGSGNGDDSSLDGTGTEEAM